MKKTLNFFANFSLVALMLTFWPMNASAQDSVEIDGLYYNLRQEGASVQKAPSDKPYNCVEVVIPDEVEYNGVKYPVTDIGNDAFMDVSTLKSIKLGENISFVGFFAFAGTDIEELSFGSNDLIIDSSAFSNCPNLQTIRFGGKTTTILSEFIVPCHVHKVIFEGDSHLWGAATAKPPMDRGLAKSSAIVITPKSNVEHNETGVCTAEIEWGDYCHDIQSFDWMKVEKFVINGSSSVYGGFSMENGEYLRTIEILKLDEDCQYPPSIAYFLFQFCPNLTSIICHDLEPRDLTQKFKFMDDKQKNQITLFVPAASIDAYKNHTVWGDFINIMPIEGGVGEMGTDDSEAEAVFYDLNGVRVERPEPGTVVVRKQGGAVSKQIIR